MKKVYFEAKKILCLGMALVMLFSFIACSRDKKEEEKIKGEFYSLEEAYENGWLDIEDVKDIYYYHGEPFLYAGGKNPPKPDFEPRPKTPEILSAKIEKAIKQTWLDEWIESDEWYIENGKLSAVHIKYYGTYNGYVAIMMHDDYTASHDSVWRFFIEDYEFGFGSGRYDIYLWKETKN